MTGNEDSDRAEESHPSCRRSSSYLRPLAPSCRRNINYTDAMMILSTALFASRTTIDQVQYLPTKPRSKRSIRMSKPLLRLTFDRICIMLWGRCLLPVGCTDRGLRRRRKASKEQVYCGRRLQASETRQGIAAARVEELTIDAPKRTQRQRTYSRQRGSEISEAVITRIRFSVRTILMPGTRLHRQRH
jgi:hypothetical protein